MRNRPPKSTPKVRDGKVQRKNRTERSRHYVNYPQDRPEIDRQRPGAGYRHVLRKRDVERFLALLPDWEELSRGLDAVVLAPGRSDLFGWHRPGLVAVCAWERELATSWSAGFVAENRALLDRLGVETDPESDGRIRITWTEPAIRGFQLLDVLLHELGHHHDRVTTWSALRAARGEAYAEEYARRHGERLWEAFVGEFGW